MYKTEQELLTIEQLNPWIDLVSFYKSPTYQPKGAVEPHVIMPVWYCYRYLQFFGFPATQHEFKRYLVVNSGNGNL